METVEFKYCYKDGEETKEIHICKKNEAGLHDYDVCEMFLDFMQSVGFSEENVFKYFSLVE